MKNDLSELIKAAYTEAPVGDDFERRVMLEVARHAIAHSRRRARRGLIASISGVAMLLAACLAALLTWLPSRLILFQDFRLPWLENIMHSAAEIVPFAGQWGGLLVLSLFVSGAAGFAYYLNGLFSESL